MTFEAQKNLAALTQVQSRRQRHKTDVPAHFSMRDLEAVEAMVSSIFVKQVQVQISPCEIRVNRAVKIGLVTCTCGTS